MNQSFITLMVVCGLLLSVIYSCNEKRNNEFKIILNEAMKPEEILPVFATIDFGYDSLATANYLKPRNFLLGGSSDSLKVNIHRYLKFSSQNPLFKRFTPNIQRRVNPFKRSVFLGFSLEEDTSIVNEILMASGILKYNVQLKWFPYSHSIVHDGDSICYRNYSSMVALSPSHAIVYLNLNDVKKMEVKKYESNGFLGNFFQTIRGKVTYFITIEFKENSLKKITDIFPEGSYIFVECNYEGEKYYCSTDVTQIRRPLTLTTHLLPKRIKY